MYSQSVISNCNMMLIYIHIYTYICKGAILIYHNEMYIMHTKTFSRSKLLDCIYSHISTTNIQLCIRTYTQKYTNISMNMYSQSESDSVILLIGRLLQLRRNDMCIVAVPKGYLYGHFRYKFYADGEVVNCKKPTIIYNEWISTPVDQIFVEFDEEIEYIIVIEKEGIFQRLCQEDAFQEKFPCLFVTGCGFPDIPTRAFVSKIHQIFPHIPILGVCDYNPYGVALLMTYQYASTNTCTYLCIYITIICKATIPAY